MLLVELIIDIRQGSFDLPSILGEFVSFILCLIVARSSSNEDSQTLTGLLVSLILTFHLLCSFSFHTLLWPDAVALKTARLSVDY